MEETRLNKMRKDKHIKEPKDRVFMCDFLRTIGKNEEKDEYLSVRCIIRIWGYERFYDELIEHFQKLIENNPDENICVHYYCGEFDKCFKHQKLLGWSIYDEKEKKFGLVGGVLFHEGEMSFHT